MMKTLFKCRRCGLCCLSGLCTYGKYKKYPICKYLIIHKDLTTTCKLIQEGKGRDLLSNGCVLQCVKGVYERYEKEFYEVKRKYAQK